MWGKKKLDGEKLSAECIMRGVWIINAGGKALSKHRVFFNTQRVEQIRSENTR